MGTRRFVNPQFSCSIFFQLPPQSHARLIPNICAAAVLFPFAAFRAAQIFPARAATPPACLLPTVQEARRPAGIFSAPAHRSDQYPTQNRQALTEITQFSNIPLPDLLLQQPFCLFTEADFRLALPDLKFIQKSLRQQGDIPPRSRSGGSVRSKTFRR